MKFLKNPPEHDVSHLKLLRNWIVKGSSKLGGFNWSSTLSLKTHKFAALMLPTCNLAERS